MVQEIDAAAMSVWLAYRHVETDINCFSPEMIRPQLMIRLRLPRGYYENTCGALNLNNNGSTPLDDFDYVKMGALISF